MESLSTGLVSFPRGDNSSDTLISGRHWNLTTLQTFGYNLYSNHMLSNNSRCYLFFEPWNSLTILSDNGTFHNSASCFSPVLPLRMRSKISLGFAALFSTALVLAVANLAKHGKELIKPRENRFGVFRRRFQWYWMIVVAAFGLVCSITTIDVDRYYLPETPFVIMSVFYFLVLLSTLAFVWESVWHWGSWLERKAIEEDPWSWNQEDMRRKVEMWIPLFFYLLIAANVFLLVPRSWSDITKQRDSEQTRLIAKPAATDLRFKIGAFLNFVSWLTIVFSLLHSIYHYRPRSQELKKFLITIPLALTMVGYEVACAFIFDIGPLKFHNPNMGKIYGLGWGVIVLILFVHGCFAIQEPNEDEELKRLRREKLVRKAISERGKAILSTKGDDERADEPALPGR